MGSERISFAGTSIYDALFGDARVKTPIGPFLFSLVP
jgi:hypothetical protein